MRMTKAGMLRRLSSGLAINILPIRVVYGRDLTKSDVWQKIAEELSPFGPEAIVRSSCRDEDTREASNAGKYESILNVPTDSAQKLRDAAKSVYDSYGTKDPNEEILIQPMLEDVAMSGVVFTLDLVTRAEYYTVNYHLGHDTSAVTGGSGEVTTFVRYKHSPVRLEDEDMEKLLETCGIIEKFLQDDALDIEFGITKSHEVYIFQVRPLAGAKKGEDARQDLAAALRRIYKKVQKLARPHPFLFGRKTMFGVMPDWNPAEILGLRPKKLAISLYKELVTDQVWAHQRTDYGYRDLTMHPLMASFCGIPYIDTRITFNSFIPASLHAYLGEKLVNYYLDKLAAFPSYHDKIEFEIVFSCYYFGVAKKLRKLLSHGFNENEIKRIEFSLLTLTNGIISPKSGIYRKDLAKSRLLEASWRDMMDSGLSLIDRIYWLIELTKAYGTLPFAGVARAAFVAVQFLDSMEAEGLITGEERGRFLNSLDTIAKMMRRDSHALREGYMTREAFLEKYGHIRPGTYDILSKRYDEAFDEYFGHAEKAAADAAEPVKFSLPDEKIARINRELLDNGLDITATELFGFMKEAIEGREYLKFVFTRCVSEILRLIGELGKRASVPLEDLSYLDISVIKEMYVDLYIGTVEDRLRANIEANRIQNAVADQLKLPSLIVSPDMVYQFHLLREEPTFVTKRRAIGTPVTLTEGAELSGKIVFIRSADPGYDFLFDRGIGGLVTEFGGANSHMAIRCAEIGLPAVIGAGEKNFSDWQKASRIEIDCQKKRVLKVAV